MSKHADMQDGEWEWPSTPGKQPSPNLGRRTFPKANTPGKDARIELNQGNEGPKFEVDLGGGLLPIPTGWGDNIGAVEGGAGQFETGENAAIGGRAPKGGRRGGSGRDKDGRARKKSTGEQREGDYAGAPRAREAAGGKWPRGMVT